MAHREKNRSDADLAGELMGQSATLAESDAALTADVLGEDPGAAACLGGAGLGSPDLLETDFIPSGRSLTIAARRRYERIGKRQQLLEVIPSPPAAGESIHVIGEGLYDFWTFVPQMVDWLGRAEEMYLSTWTTCRANVVELFELIDTGRIGAVVFLTGLYFKRRETAVYTYLVNSLRRRGPRFRYKAFANHAKVLLARGPGPAAAAAWLVCEGSANLTANPRLEQYVFTNDRGLYEFHRGWMEEALAK